MNLAGYEDWERCGIFAVRALYSRQHQNEDISSWRACEGALVHVSHALVRCGCVISSIIWYSSSPCSPHVLFDYSKRMAGKVPSVFESLQTSPTLAPPILRYMQRHQQAFRTPTWFPLLSSLLWRRSPTRSLSSNIYGRASTMSTRPSKNAAASAPAVEARYCHTCGRIICKS